MKIVLRILLLLIFIGSIAATIFLLKTEVHYSSIDASDQYAITIERYNFNEYFQTEDDSLYVKFTFMQLKDSTEEVLARFKKIRIDPYLSWGMDSLFINRRPLKKLPTSLSIDQVDYWHRKTIPLYKKLKTAHDINGDGFLDLFGSYREDDEIKHYFGVCLNKGNDTYDCIKSDYYENYDELVGVTAYRGKLVFRFSEEKRNMNWSREMTFTLDSTASEPRFLLSKDNIVFDSVDSGYEKISDTTNLGTAITKNYSFEKTGKFGTYHYNYYNYPEESEESYLNEQDNIEDEVYYEETLPKDYVETLKFLDAVNHNTTVNLQPMTYDFSKFVKYHGDYERSLGNNAKVSVADEGELRLIGIKDLNIIGDNSTFVNSAGNKAILKVTNQGQVVIKNITMFHDTKTYSCTAPVLEATDGVYVKMDNVVLDGSGLIGIEAYESAVVFNNSTITNCSSSAIYAVDSQVFFDGSTITDNYMSSIIQGNNSGIVFKNSTIENNFLQEFYDYEDTEVYYENTTIAYNFCQSFDNESNTLTSKGLEVNNNKFNVFTYLHDTLALTQHLVTINENSDFLNSSSLRFQLETTPLNIKNLSIYKQLLQNLVLLEHPYAVTLKKAIQDFEITEQP